MPAHDRPYGTGLRFASEPEERELVQRIDGVGERVCTARWDKTSNQWDIALTHPSGQQWRGTFNGPEIDLAMSRLMADHRNEFVNGGSPRGDSYHGPGMSRPVEDSVNTIPVSRLRAR